MPYGPSYADVGRNLQHYAPNGIKNGITFRILRALRIEARVPRRALAAKAKARSKRAP